MELSKVKFWVALKTKIYFKLAKGMPLQLGRSTSRCWKAFDELLKLTIS